MSENPHEKYDSMSRDELIQQLVEYDALFDLRWKADMRGIAKWKKTTKRKLVLPDHGELIAHLLERLAHAESVIDSARVLCDRTIDGNEVSPTQCEEFEIVASILIYEKAWNLNQSKV